MKRRRPDAVSKACYERSVKKNNKWRGMTPEAYAKKYPNGFRSGVVAKECEHIFTDGECIHCKMQAREYYAKHPKKLAYLINSFRKTKTFKKLKNKKVDAYLS